MSDAERLREMRMELLRMRAMVQRAEAAAAARELREDTRRLRTFAGAAGSLGAALRGRRDWLGLIAGSITGRPWLASLALVAVRGLKRRPLLAAAAVAAVVAGLRIVRPSRGAADGGRGGEPDQYGA